LLYRIFSDVLRVLLLCCTMPSRYYLQDFPDKEIIQQIIVLKDKLEEIEAIEKYFERNFLFELGTFTRQKKIKIQQKLKNTLDMYKVYCLSQF